MSNKRETAVDWLMEQIKSDIFCDHIRGVQYWDKDTLIEFLKQAKAIEREQRLEDFKSGFQAAFDSLQGANNLVQKKTYDIHTEKGED